MATPDDPIPLFVDAPTAPRPRLHRPPEPGYYRATDGLARFLLAACSLLMAAALAAGAYGASRVLESQAGRPPQAVIMAFFLAAGPFILTTLSLLSTIIAALLMRLAVDVARNVRDLRYAG